MFGQIQQRGGTTGAKLFFPRWIINGRKANLFLVEVAMREVTIITYMLIFSRIMKIIRKEFLIMLYYICGEILMMLVIVVIE